MQIDSAIAKQRDKNRAALSRIIAAIEYYGRLGLPVRGHTDSGSLQMKDNIDYCRADFSAFIQ